MFNSETESGLTAKAERTRQKILGASLDLFREKGFENATMREIARRAGVALGAAYYYYPSKEAIILDFYQRSYEEMQAKIESAVRRVAGVEHGLRELIRAKIEHFAPNRSVLRALLRNGADPAQSVSPFSRETKAIRDQDIAWFRQILNQSGVRIPRDLEPHLPGVLWFVQMGVIFFWVIDESPQQRRTERLLQLASKSAAILIRLAGMPLMKPLRSTAIEIIENAKAGVS
jgi:AcrR family transcriptional regulator